MTEDVSTFCSQVRRELAPVVARLEQLGNDVRARELDERKLNYLLVGLQECVDRLADLEYLSLRASSPNLRFLTNYPVAVSSDDHKFPRGVRNDNSRHPRFVRRIEEIFDRKVAHLDLGCAGGGLVLDFLLRGHKSVGVEGSDFALREQRAEWRVIPRHLFTADMTKPFRFERRDGTRMQFDVITAWEVLEHIPEGDLPGLFDNISGSLATDGLFVASIASFVDRDPETGVVYHVTLRPREWWLDQMVKVGFESVDGLFQPGDFVRGSGNQRVGPLGRNDWDVLREPEKGFHLVAKKRS